MYLRFNLPSLHHSDGLVKKVLAFDKKDLQKGRKRIARLPSKDITKSSTISTFEVKDETKCHLPESFWNPRSNIFQSNKAVKKIIAESY